MAHYSYDPSGIKVPGRDRMRFELGDVMVAGEEETCALSDEEYEAVLERFPDSWGKAKLALVESILRRLSYEADTRVGGLSLSLRQRAEEWRRMYECLKAETAGHGVSAAVRAAPGTAPYFREGIHNNRTRGDTEGGGRVVP